MLLCQITIQKLLPVRDSVPYAELQQTCIPYATCCIFCNGLRL